MDVKIKLEESQWTLSITHTEVGQKPLSILELREVKLPRKNNLLTCPSLLRTLSKVCP